MNFMDLQHLQTERNMLSGLLDRIPESDVIDRIGLQERMEEIDRRLTSELPLPGPTRVRLVFRGKPVLGSRGIFAEFGARAVSAFSEAVAAVGASLAGALNKNLTARHREDCQLVITGTAVGSFGFELEEPTAPQDPSSGPSLVRSALDRTTQILESSLASDESLSDAISDVNPTALDKIRAFLKTMTDSGAACTLDIPGRRFRFDDLRQVLQSEQRLRPDNIRETVVELAGAFQGVLPERRAFEFRLSETGAVIGGKIDGGFEEAARINHVLGNQVLITVQTRQVGDGKPRYTLLSYR